MQEYHERIENKKSEIKEGINSAKEALKIAKKIGLEIQIELYKERIDTLVEYQEYLENVVKKDSSLQECTKTALSDYRSKIPEEVLMVIYKMINEGITKDFEIWDKNNTGESFLVDSSIFSLNKENKTGNENIEVVKLGSWKNNRY